MKGSGLLRCSRTPFCIELSPCSHLSARPCHRIPGRYKPEFLQLLGGSTETIKVGPLKTGSGTFEAKVNEMCNGLIRAGKRACG